MRNTRFMRSGHKGGFTLLEVLIALLIFSFGMLGLAALQTYSVKANQSANFRSQATALANTLLDNVRANRSHIADYYSNTYSAGDCDTAATGTGADLDLSMWQRQIACELPQGQSAVAPISDKEIAVCLRWSDSRLQQGDTTGTSCTDDASTFGAGASGDGTGAGIDGESSVFVVTARL